MVYVPFLNDAFDTTGLSLTDWLLCTAMASAVWPDELRKLVALRHRAVPA